MLQNNCRAFLGFGGNLGDPLTHFRDARKQLDSHPRIKVISTSSLYRTPPIGGPTGQPDYLNSVIEIETGLSAPDLLQLCFQLEDHAGRIRNQRWEARTLDIDLLLVGDLIMDAPHLILPHPRLHQRHFVLLPLNDLSPQLRHPFLNKTVTELLGALPPADGIICLKEIW